MVWWNGPRINSIDNWIINACGRVFKEVSRIAVRELTRKQKEGLAEDLAPALRNILRVSGTDVDLKYLIDHLESDESRILLDIPDEVLDPLHERLADVVTRETKEVKTTSGKGLGSLQPLEVKITGGVEAPAKGKG